VTAIERALTTNFSGWPVIMSRTTTSLTFAVAAMSSVNVRAPSVMALAS
jgi:hypothetical protein